MYCLSLLMLLTVCRRSTVRNKKTHNERAHNCTVMPLCVLHGPVINMLHASRAVTVLLFHFRFGFGQFKTVVFT